MLQGIEFTEMKVERLDHLGIISQTIKEYGVRNDRYTKWGVPIFSQAWDRNESGSQIFKERSAALVVRQIFKLIDE